MQHPHTAIYDGLWAYSATRYKEIWNLLKLLRLKTKTIVLRGKKKPPLSLGT